MVLERSLLFLFTFFFLITAFAKDKVKVEYYYLGKVKEKEVITTEINLPKRLNSVFSECECLHTEFKEGDLSLKVRLDTTGYKEKNEVFLYLIFEDSSVMKVVLSFEVIP